MNQSACLADLPSNHHTSSGKASVEKSVRALLLELSMGLSVDLVDDEVTLGAEGECNGVTGSSEEDDDPVDGLDGGLDS